MIYQLLECPVAIQPCQAILKDTYLLVLNLPVLDRDCGIETLILYPPKSISIIRLTNDCNNLFALILNLLSQVLIYI